ncbi:MAG: ATPase [Gracilibacteraceae bacterium]|nr:ATPase [Gracilibacteraceae bacterium]
MESRIDGLLEQIEELVDRAAKVPLTNKVMVDSDAVLNILDELRRTVPEEVANARIITGDRERILTEARSEAKGMLEQARKQAENLVSDDAIARQGRLQAESMVSQAERYYMEVKQGALVYSNKVLQDLEGTLGTMLRQVQSNRGELAEQARSQEASG